MYYMKFKIKGILPLLFDSFQATLEDSLKQKGKTKKVAAVGEWSKNQLYFSEKSKANGGCISIPIKHWLEQAIIEGARRVKIGRKSLKDEASKIKVVEEYYDTKHKEPGIVVKSFPKNQTNGSRVYSEKPGFKNWECEFTLQILNDAIPAVKIEELIESLGLYQGLGAWRKKYGMFIPVNSKILDKAPEL